MKKLKNVAQRGCPDCMGKKAAECKRCEGKTWMFDWYQTEKGSWEHIPGKQKR